VAEQGVKNRNAQEEEGELAQNENSIGPSKKKTQGKESQNKTGGLGGGLGKKRVHPWSTKSTGLGGKKA